MVRKIIFCLILLNYSLNMIVFPFKTAYVNKNGNIDQNNEEYNATHFMNDYFERLIYTEIKLGEPPQDIKVILTDQDCGFKIGQARKCIYENDYLSYYNISISNSFNYTDLYTYILMEFDEGCSAQDSIYLYNDINLKNYTKFNKMDFYLGSDTSDLLCGVIGFKMDSYDNYCPKLSAIRRLKENKITDNYNWIIKYNSSDEGLLIIGTTMNKIISNFDPNKLFTIYTKYLGGNYPWSFDIDEIICGENTSLTASEMWAEINNDFSFLQGNRYYEQYISENFFNDLIKENKCRKILWNNNNYNNYYIFECDKKEFGIEQINNFPSLTFINKNLGTEIKFNKNELFTETKYKYFFNIIFSYYGSRYWIFGKLFLKKYPTMINLDENLIHIYNNVNEEEEKDEYEEEKEEEREEEGEEEEGEEEEGNRDNEEDSEKDKKKDDKIIGLSKTNFILLIAGIIVFIFIIGVLCYFLIKRYNRQKANELNFDYISKKENNDISLPSL